MFLGCDFVYLIFVLLRMLEFLMRVNNDAGWIDIILIVSVATVSSASGAASLVWDGQCAALLGRSASDGGSFWRSSTVPFR